MIRVPPTALIPIHNNGHWQYDKKMGSGVGFIYVIRDNVLRKLYLGKKLYRGHGKLNKGKESNWKKYKSSSKTLALHFAERPMEEFDFICIGEYATKGGLAYAETWSLCYTDALTTDAWYNKMIGKISWNVTELVSIEHKKRLNDVINWRE